MGGDTSAAYDQLRVLVSDLLDAMDRQYGNPTFSSNVEIARKELRRLIPGKRDPADQSRLK